MKGIDLLNGQQLQDFRNFLNANKGHSVDDVIYTLNEKIKYNIPINHQQKRNMIEDINCPDCDTPMRKEIKGDEAVWNCLACSYSKYIGVK